MTVALAPRAQILERHKNCPSRALWALVSAPGGPDLSPGLRAEPAGVAICGRSRQLPRVHGGTVYPNPFRRLLRREALGEAT